MDGASRRLAVLERHCCAGDPGTSSTSDIQRSSCSTSYASVGNTPSSYARVHGQVSIAPAEWREIQCVAKERLSEVKYAKSAEGIAKVLRRISQSTAVAVVEGQVAVHTLTSCAGLCVRGADHYQPT